MKRWVIAAMAPLAVLAIAVAVPVFAQKSNPAPLWSEHQVTQAVDDLERAIEKRHPGSSTLLLVHRNGGDLYIALGS